MALSAPAASIAAGVLLLLLALVPSAPAQAPEDADPSSSAMGFAVIVPQSFSEVGYLGSVLVPMLVKDLSRDSGNAEELPGGGVGFSPSGHSVELTLKEIRPEGAEGWQVLVGQSFIPITGGETIETTVQIQTNPQLNVPEISVDIEAVYTGPNGFTQNQTITLGAKVARYDAALIQVKNPAEEAGQFENVRFMVAVTNDGVYPDSYRFSTSTDREGFQLIPPPNLYVPAKSTRYTNVTVLTPKGELYEFGENAVINIQAQSVTGSGVYTAVGVLKVRGAYISSYWTPILLVGLVSAAILARERSQNAELRRLEKGRPRHVAPTPRQTVMLAELKRRDPEAYAAKKAALDAVYAARREKFRGERKERAARDKAEHKQAKAEMVAEQKRKKAAAIAAKKQAKLDKKAAKKQAKLDKKEAKKQAKLDKKEAKVLAKKRKALEKQKAKLEKQHAKASAKEAKKQAKLEKAAARQAKREAKKQKRG